MPNGEGKYWWAHFYEGKFKDGRMHGDGKYKGSDGDVHEGKFKSGLMHGSGKMKKANGDVYIGEWREDEMHGRITLKEANGDVYKQEYNNGELVSRGKRCVTADSIKAITGTPSQRSRTDEVVGVLALNETDVICTLCTEEFSTDLNSGNGEAKRRLPVLGSCNHVFCHGCVLNQQSAIAEQSKSGRVSKRIKCMECQRASAFCPSEPKYDRNKIDFLSRYVPVASGDDLSN